MSDFKIPTPESLLQLGHDCGLNTVHEAYSCMMNHYDAFFLIDKINEQVLEFHNSLVAAGLAESKQQIRLIEQTIESAARQLGYAFKDYPACAELETQLEKEEFEFDPFEFEVSGPDLMDAEHDSSGD